MSIDKVSTPPITSSPQPFLGSGAESSAPITRGSEHPSGEHLGLSGRSQRTPDETGVSRRFADAAISAVSTATTALTGLLGASKRTTSPAAGDIEAGVIHSTAPVTEPPATAATTSTQGATGVDRPAAAVMERLEKAIKAAESRTVDPEAAANLVNTLRRMGPRGGPAELPRLADNKELMKGVTDAEVKKWYAAQGLTDANVEALRSGAFRSGLPNPTGSFLNNAVQYIASPFTGADKGPWAGAGLGFAAALAGAPMNAFQQSAVVTVCESIREHLGPVIVPDKNNINDKHYLPELTKKFENDVKEFSSAHDTLQTTMRELGFASDTNLASKLESLNPADKQKLQEQVTHLLEAETKLYDTQRDFMMTQGAHERQWKGNTWQSIPRTLRAPVAGYTGMTSKLNLGTFFSPTMQTVASVVLTAGQHLAAGFDERNKQEYNNKLNLMYGDFFTAQGNEKIKSGQPLEASDIDQKKLRGFVNMPEQSLVKHVSAEVKRQVQGLEKLLADTTGPTRPEADIGRDRNALETLKADAEKLKSGKLTELTPGGLAESLLVASEKSSLSEQLINDVKAKYTKREFSAQTAQRVGQMFHLFVGGSAASSVIGKVSSAAVGGSKKAPIHQTAIVSAVSGAMAGYGAANQHTAISVKNNRREADADPGLWAQVKRGVMGGWNESVSQSKGSKTSHEMNAKLAEEDIGQTLKFAKDVKEALGLAQTTLEVPLSRPPHVGDTSTSGIKQIAINIPESTPVASEAGTSAGTSDKGKEKVA